jgi:multiple sugar transport system substrate-binding protein
MVYRAAVKTGVIFRLEEQEGAKQFVTFLLQEDNLTPYVEDRSAAGTR